MWILAVSNQDRTGNKRLRFFFFLSLFTFSLSNVVSIRNRQWCRPVLHLSANTEKPMGETPANVSSTSASHLSHHDVTLSTKVPFAPHLPVPSAPPRSVTVQHTATMKPLICSPGTQVFKFIYTVSTMFTDQQRIYMTIHKLLQVPQMLLIKST